MKWEWGQIFAEISQALHCSRTCVILTHTSPSIQNPRLTEQRQSKGQCLFPTLWLWMFTFSHFFYYLYCCIFCTKTDTILYVDYWWRLSSVKAQRSSYSNSLNTINDTIMSVLDFEKVFLINKEVRCKTLWKSPPSKMRLLSECSPHRV